MGARSSQAPFQRIPVRLPQVSICGRLFQQLDMLPNGFDRPFINDYNLIRLCNGAEMMSNDNEGLAAR